jgi:hypothetical protein
VTDRPTLRQTLATPLFAALAMLALAFNLLVPPGYMTVGDGAGGTRVVLCTGNGAVAVTLAADGTPLPADSDPAPVCAFAGHVAPLQPVADLYVPAPVYPVAAGLIAALVIGVAPGRGMAAPPPPSHAPPALTN